MTVELILGDCIEIMDGMDDESVDLVVTSPPYFNLRKYSQWDSYEEYLNTVEKWFAGISRILKRGRYVFWNVQETYPSKLIDPDMPRKHIPLSADTIQRAVKCLNYECNIIWYKGKAGATQRMFGSYPYPPTLIISWLHENILVFRKEGKAEYERREEDLLTKDEWVDLTNSIWEFPPESNSEHPAPYPIDLPMRAIKGWSFTNDLVFDPFLGSGTTGLACVKTGRRFIGSEIDPQYYHAAKNRIDKVRLQPRLI